MERIEIKYHQILFLYAYLRLVDLSLDRSRWDWRKGIEYFETMLSPQKVLQYLKQSFDLNEEDWRKIVYLPRTKFMLEKIRIFLSNKILFRKKELLYCCILLSDFEKIREFDFKEYNLEIEQLRINIAKYYTEVMSNYIRNRDLIKLMSIEHYNQSDKSDGVKLKEFIPNDFRK